MSSCFYNNIIFSADALEEDLQESLKQKAETKAKENDNKDSTGETHWTEGGKKEMWSLVSTSEIAMCQLAFEQIKLTDNIK